MTLPFYVIYIQFTTEMTKDKKTNVYVQTRNTGKYAPFRSYLWLLSLLSFLTYITV